MNELVYELKVLRSEMKLVYELFVYELVYELRVLRWEMTSVYELWVMKLVYELSVYYFFFNHNHVILCYALLTCVRIPLSVLPTVHPKCFTDRSPMCFADHGCITS